MTDQDYQKKRYIKGVVRTAESNNGRKVINISVNVSQLALIENEQWYANIALYELPEKDQYWNTHFIVEN